MSEIKCKLTYKKDGTPFPTEATAKSYLVRAKLIGAEVVKLKDGFVVKAPDSEETQKEEVKQEGSVKTAEEQATPPAQPQEVVDIEKRPDIKIVKTYRPRDAAEIPEKYKDPAFDYKLVYNHKKAVEKKLRARLGWEIDRLVASKMREDGLLFADGSCDSTLIIGDTILMRVPKPNAEAYRKYYKERTMDGLKEKQKKYEENVRAAGSQATGSVEVTTRHLS